MKILLFGANGQVGHELRRSLAPLADVVCTTRTGLLADGSACEAADFDRPAELPGLIARIAPDVVVNAAAYTAVDRAEDDCDAAFRANAEAPGVLAAACAAQGALLVHYSTDYVFDGTGNRPLREDDPTAPLGAYGRSKLEGERAIGQSGCHHLILRTAWVYALHGQNFLRTMLRLGTARDTLRVVADQVGSPTPAWLIADASAAILRQGVLDSGVRHLVAGGQTSWHGFAEAIFAQADARGLLARVPRVEAIATSEYPTPAPRPAWAMLDSSRLVAEYGLELPDWHQALVETFDRGA
ncbi:MAG: dTDP-4-dehydrorhamnose reductase [Pseudomonadota bacterium]|nr:dTDP-4-dehydrorhamnose reductase [Pseudomonadota bacterium]